MSKTVSSPSGSPGAEEEVAVAAALEAVAAAAAALDARESMAEEMETASRVGVQAESGTEGVALTSFILSYDKKSYVKVCVWI